jgi:hypothetical protein
MKPSPKEREASDEISVEAEAEAEDPEADSAAGVADTKLSGVKISSFTASLNQQEGSRGNGSAFFILVA